MITNKIYSGINYMYLNYWLLTQWLEKTGLASNILDISYLIMSRIPGEGETTVDVV